MKTTSERRLAIRDAISERRHTTVRELARDFGVCERTIFRDLEAISATTSFYYSRGTGGGVHATDGWYASKRYYTGEQEAFLRKLQEGLQTDSDKRMMESILNAFAMPRHKES